MHKFHRLIAFAAAAVFVCSLASCNFLKKHLQKSETISIDLTNGWVPLYAVEVGGTDYTTLCSANPTTVNDMVAATSYASLWNDLKNNLDSVSVLDINYAVEANISAGGSVDLYLVGQIPGGLSFPGGIPGLDASQWRVVDWHNLNPGDMVASLPIPNGADVPEWGAGNFVNGGDSTIENQFMDYTGQFGFCIHLNVPTHALTSATPDLKIQMTTDVKLTFTP